MTLSSVFVYGTLKRGQCRASMWPAEPTAVLDSFVRGALFDRADYPALCPGNDRVLGELWSFTGPNIDLVLSTLDQIECTNQPNRDDLYLRVVVDVFDIDGKAITQAYSYYYATDPADDGFTLIRAGADDYVVWPAAE